MYQGKQAADRSTPKRRRRLRWRKEFVLLCSIVVLLVGMIGGTVAYLVTNTDPVTNTFTTPNIDVEIKEDFNEEVKKDVYFTNTSDFPVYVRATYVAYWVKDNTTNEIYPSMPTLTTQNLGSDWIYNSTDGYYYYNSIVQPNQVTKDFIEEISTTETIEGYHLVVEVIVETVQAEPVDAVKDVWGFVPNTTSAG